ncbi:class I adenylate-forming enzyme family protein [Nocardia sp. CDC160]|uniref:class I adenylate-forming enzyme family protein n=1 Tax=Nocardia sp. CDC160 TaxID=3112166 RepID=UPI002DBC5C44|nr:class I adenylate-forming enzyme family protein [Nocardia sp. CDC160]MEC3919623.1 class I adenylate-forming enzyme family protein [Nocardia sp. CDC160]
MDGGLDSGSAGEDFTALLREQVLRTPDAPALGMIGEPPLSFAELDARIRLVVKRLHSRGFRPGDRMLFSIRPCVDAVVLILGTVTAGGTIVFVDPGVGPELFARRLELVRPTWAATESLLYLLSGPLRRYGRRLGLSLPEFGKLPLRHIHCGPRLPGTPRGSIPLRQLIGSEPGWSGPASGSTVDTPVEDPEAEALIVFTSGTTAAPKAVVHTRGSLGAGLTAMAGSTTLMPGSHLHTEQLMMGLPAVLEGARWSMPRYPRFETHIDPVGFARTLDTATHAFFTPADLAVALDAVESGRVPAPTNLEEISLGGAPVTPALLRRARAALPDTEFLAIYGMTEILPVAIVSGTDKLDFDAPGDLLGPPAEGVDARIADDGELILSGPNLCRGYLGEPALKEIATGDLARFEGDTLVLMGRKKDMMIRGKTNIYPGLYEPAIATVAGVRQAIMVGIPDEIGDERIVLAVVADPDAGDVESRLRRELPTLIDVSALPDDIVTVAEIPVSGRTRKPDRAALRTLLERRIG